MAAAKDLSDKQRLVLESVEHMSLEMLTEVEGDKHIWKALDERFPDKQKHGWMMECLREVFQTTSAKGETMKFGHRGFKRCSRSANGRRM